MQGRHRPGDHRLDLRTKFHRAHRRVRQAVAFHGEQFRKSVLGSKRHMIDLGQIMVLGSQPENRNAVHSGRRRLFRQLDRGQRLEDRKQRAAKKTDLLSRNRRQRSSPEALDIGQRLGRGAPRLVLPLQNFADLGATRGVVNHALGFFFHPVGKNRRAWIHAAN